MSTHSVRHSVCPAALCFLWSDLLRGENEAIGAEPYIGELVNNVATAANVKHYVKILKDKAMLRTLISTAGRISTSCFDPDANAKQVVDKAEAEIFTIADANIKNHPERLDVLMGKAFEEIQKIHREGGITSGVPSGFHALDEMTTGFHPGELIIVAARPGMGKTSFALSMALNAAARAKRKVATAVFSLEMPKAQLIQRMLCSEARIDMHRLRSGKLGKRELNALAIGAGPLYEAPMYFDDTPGMNVMELRAKCRRIKAKDGLGLVMIDYLQLMNGVEKSENRQNEVAQISRSLKEIAKELEIPIIALSQLSRSVEQRTGDKKPQLSDLRESGSIEQDADCVLFIYRDWMYNKETTEQNVAEIIIGKQRNGPTGSVKLAFIKEFAAFENLDLQHGDEPQEEF